MSTASSSNRPLTDEEVQNEMKKMVAFIKQEAVEKAREIQVKADEEFNIEKAKLVRQETLHIESLFERKSKQTEVARKIAHSTHVNKARLKVLEAREAMLEELFQSAKICLPELIKDQGQYQVMLNGLVLQCFYQLMESNIQVQCRANDVGLVQSAINNATAEFKKVLNRDISATIDNENFIDCAGGVIASALDGRIRCLNTLESRLQLLYEQMLPDIRVLLFGVSEIRRFYN